MSDSPTSAAIAAVLRGHRYLFDDEIELQDGLEDALSANGIAGEREVRLSSRDRIDFLIGRVGIEVKIGGNVDSLVRQLTRYAHSDQIDELIAVVSRPKLSAVPGTVAGVPVQVVFVGGVA